MDLAVRRVWRWLFAPVPLTWIALFRTAAYLFVPVDVLWAHTSGGNHGSVVSMYRPLLVGRMLHLPLPTDLVVDVVKWSVVALALLAATGRLPRLLGTAVFALWFEWTLIAFSYGKVDHDRFAFLVALAVLPTVGRARFGDRTPSQTAGWAVRCVQLAVVATYFLAAWAKIRMGGWQWVNSATLVWAVHRRGTPVALPLLRVPELLHAAQWGIVIMELASPLILVVGPRLRSAGVAWLLGFHIVTVATIGIIFLPHVLCLVLSFLPAELLWPPGERAPVPRSEGSEGSEQEPTEPAVVGLVDHRGGLPTIGV